jgi:hypothetical protein
MLAWIATAAFVLGAVAVLFLLRQEIMAAWPPAVRLYMALGLSGPGA